MFIDMAAQPHRLGNDECDQQCHQAENLEVHPLRFGEMAGKSNVQVEQAGNDEKSGPAVIELVPDRSRHADLFTHEFLHEISAGENTGSDQYGAEQPVQHSGFPLDERIVLKQQGCASEDHNDHQVDPVGGFDDPAHDLKPEKLTHTGNDGYSCCHVNVVKPEGNEEQDQGEQVEQEFFHRGLQMGASVVC